MQLRRQEEVTSSGPEKNRQPAPCQSISWDASLWTLPPFWHEEGWRNQGPPASDRISAHDPSYTQAIGFYTTCLKEDTWQISQRSVETATICSKISVKGKQKNPHGVREHTGLMISPLGREKLIPAGGWIRQRQWTTWVETADKFIQCRIWIRFTVMCRTWRSIILCRG